jgi:hypothetical protein
MSMELFLFTVDPVLAAAATRAGVAGVVVDWERAGKHRRQAGADTQINADTPDDLARVRRAVDARVLCRINAFGPSTAGEIAEAVRAGADEVLVPMVRTRAEVEHVLELARGRVGVGILVETVDAADHPEQFADLPVTRAYIGLNDLAIERGSRSIFRAIVDGTVDDVASAVRVPLGFGGLTDPDRGDPVPCRLLVAALARAGASFTFLRRSFLRDLDGRDPAPLVARIHAATTDAATAPRAVLDDALTELRARVDAIEAVTHR